jgi:hypothetical protein
LTWGEDVARHINAHIDTVAKNSFLKRVIIALTNKNVLTLGFFVFNIIFVSVLILGNNSMQSAYTMYFDESRKITSPDKLDIIIQKIDLMMQALAVKDTATQPLTWLMTAGFVSFGILSFGELLFKRLFRSFVVMNDHTKLSASRYQDGMQKIKWALITTCFIGAPVALIMAYLKGYFHIS